MTLWLLSFLLCCLVKPKPFISVFPVVGCRVVGFSPLNKLSPTFVPPFLNLAILSGLVSSVGALGVCILLLLLFASLPVLLMLALGFGLFGAFFGFELFTSLTFPALKPSSLWLIFRINGPM